MYIYVDNEIYIMYIMKNSIIEVAMQHIRQVRVKAGISVKDIAKLIETDVSSFYHYEKGRRTPDFTQCWKIVNALNQLGAKCTFSDVFPNPIENSDGKVA